MSRNISDLAVVSETPPVGTHRCKCLSVVRGESKNTKTPQLSLTWQWTGGTFTDEAYITPKTVSRLAVIAMHVCAFPKEHPLPDDDMEAAESLAQYIEQYIAGRLAMVTIGEEKNQDPAKPPRRKVTFGGYAAVQSSAAATTASAPSPAAPKPPDDLPF